MYSSVQSDTESVLPISHVCTSFADRGPEKGGKLHCCKNSCIESTVNVSARASFDEAGSGEAVEGFNGGYQGSSVCMLDSKVAR